MANRVYIDIIGADITFSSICTEDINIQAVSQFTRISDLVPEMNTLVSLITTSTSVLDSTVSSRLGWVQNALDVPIWQKTEPVKIPVDLNFFVKSSGYQDVWRPAMLLQSMCILSKKGSKLITPGFNINTIGKAGETVSDANIQNIQSKARMLDGQMASYNESKDFPVDFPKTSKMCSVYIPGIVYVPLAILETIQITWSKQLTDKGYPIWAKCNCQFTGAYPAVFEDNFKKWILYSRD